MYITFRYDVLITKKDWFLNIKTKGGLKIMIGNYSKNSNVPSSIFYYVVGSLVSLMLGFRKLTLRRLKDWKLLFIENEVFKVLFGFSGN